MAMKEYLRHIPKEYWNEIKDFYEDAGGWWIVLNSDSIYWYDPCWGYGTETVINEKTLNKAVNEFKVRISLREA